MVHARDEFKGLAHSKGVGKPPPPVPDLSKECLFVAHPVLLPRARLLGGSVLFLPLCSFSLTDFHPGRNWTSSWERKKENGPPVAASQPAQPAGGITVTNLTGTFKAPFTLPRGLLLKMIYVGVK